MVLFETAIKTANGKSELFYLHYHIKWCDTTVILGSELY